MKISILASWALIKQLMGNNEATKQQVLMEVVLHRMRFEEYILPLIFPVLLHCKGEADHLLLLHQGCMMEGLPSDAVHIEVGGSMGNLVGRMVASDLCRGG